MLRIKFPPETTNIAEAIKHCCRLCLKDIESGSKIYTVFEDRINGTLIHRLISHFFRVDLNPDHGQSMCELCFQHLVNTKKFSDTITRSNGILVASIEEHFDNRKETDQVEFAAIGEDQFDEESEAEIKDDENSDWQISSESEDSSNGAKRKWRRRSHRNSENEGRKIATESNNTVKFLCESVTSLMEEHGKLAVMVQKISEHLDITSSFSFTKISTEEEYEAIEHKLTENGTYASALRNHIQKKCKSSLPKILDLIYDENFLYMRCNANGQGRKINLTASKMFQIVICGMPGFDEVDGDQMKKRFSAALKTINNRFSNRRYYLKRNAAKAFGEESTRNDIFDQECLDKENNEFDSEGMDKTELTEENQNETENQGKIPFNKKRRTSR